MIDSFWNVLTYRPKMAFTWFVVIDCLLVCDVSSFYHRLLFLFYLNGIDLVPKVGWQLYSRSTEARKAAVIEKAFWELCFCLSYRSSLPVLYERRRWLQSVYTLCTSTADETFPFNTLIQARHDCQLRMLTLRLHLTNGIGSEAFWCLLLPWGLPARLVTLLPRDLARINLGA